MFKPGIYPRFFDEFDDSAYGPCQNLLPKGVEISMEKSNAYYRNLITVIAIWFAFVAVLSSFYCMWYPESSDLTRLIVVLALSAPAFLFKLVYDFIKARKRL